MEVVYYESLKRELKTKITYGYRCDERLKTNVKESFFFFGTFHGEFIINRPEKREGETEVRTGSVGGSNNGRSGGTLHGPVRWTHLCKGVPLYQILREETIIARR